MSRGDIGNYPGSRRRSTDSSYLRDRFGTHLGRWQRHCRGWAGLVLSSNVQTHETCGVYTSKLRAVSAIPEMACAVIDSC